jgi:hypothetical protein
MASERAYAHPRLNANAEGPAKKEVGYSSAMLADGTTAVRSVPRGIRHFPPATTAIQRVHDVVRPGKTSDLSTTSAWVKPGSVPACKARPLYPSRPDLVRAPRQVRFVPLPDSCAAAIASLLDDLSAGEQHGRHVDPLRLGRLEVDDQFKFRRSIKRNLLRTFALENISDWGGEAAK